jgi:hypothetical protein
MKNREPVQQVIPDGLTPPNAAQPEIPYQDQPEENAATGYDLTKLVYVLQCAQDYVGDADDSGLFDAIQRQIDNIKEIETDYLSAESRADDADENYKSDGDCLDFIIDRFGFEVR